MRRPKHPEVVDAVRRAVEARQVTLTPHAMERISRRLVPHGLGVPDVLWVLKRGYHEARKDEWVSERKCWNYAIRGKTMEGAELRVPVALEIAANGVIVVTVINLDLEE